MISSLLRNTNPPMMQGCLYICNERDWVYGSCCNCFDKYHILGNLNLWADKFINGYWTLDWIKCAEKKISFTHHNVHFTNLCVTLDWFSFHKHVHPVLSVSWVKSIQPWVGTNNSCHHGSRVHGINTALCLHMNATLVILLSVAS